MKLPALLTSDLHLTAQPDAEYRWLLFDWLADEIKHEEVKTLAILGDIVDQKDHHPAELTNRLVNEIARLAGLVEQVYILQGNHDYLRRGHSYFKFLNHLPNVRFVTEITDDGDQGGPLTLMLPHTHTPGKDWAGLDFTHYNYVFMHQTIGGAVASNGQVMEGEEWPVIRGPKVYSGDIHVPQITRGIEYVGSPYHVHFGDKFKPRCVLIDRRARPVDLHFPSIQRVAIKVRSYADLCKQDLHAGDQVKVTLTLDAAEARDWQKIRRQCEAWLTKQRVQINGLSLAISRPERRLTDGQGGTRVRLRLSDPDAILRFVEREELGPEALEAGLEALK